jgi:hypothetical protein
MGPAALEGRVCRNGLEPRGVRSRTDDEHVLGLFPSAFQRDGAVALVGRNHNIGQAEIDFLDQRDGFPQPAPVAEFGFEQLRVDVMMIENVGSA